MADGHEHAPCQSLGPTLAQGTTVGPNNTAGREVGQVPLATQVSPFLSPHLCLPPLRDMDPASPLTIAPVQRLLQTAERSQRVVRRFVPSSRGDLHPPDVAKLQDSLADTLSKTYSETYWASTQSIYTRFITFAQDLHARKYKFTLVEMGLLWVQMLLDDGSIHVQSAPQYLTNLSSALKAFHGLNIMDEEDSHLWTMFRRAMYREGALNPLHQAPPLKFETMLDIARDPSQPVMHRMSVVVAWLTAARGADLRILTRRRISLQGNELKLDFTGAKNDPFRLGLHSTVVVPEEFIEPLRTYLESVSPDQQPFPMTGDQITRLLRHYDPALSGHSIRRGALRHLLLLGASLGEIRVFGRYKTEEGLLHYLPLADLPLQRQMRTTSHLLFQAVANPQH